MWQYYLEGNAQSFRKGCKAMELPPVVYKILPIIVILLISWLFGMIGAKKRGPAAEDSQGHEPQGEPAQAPLSLSDLFLPQVKPEDDPRGVAANQAQEAIRMGHEAQGIDVSKMGKGPVVTAEPIEPRWWGS
jgi:hypothetical protein